MQVDKHESARAVKKAELIDNLKRLYPGVVSTDITSVIMTVVRGVQELFKL